ncbi:MAG: hypothetical protein GY832_15405 [Chloroflexi bacterium]|nr:hypothetical protein [Chloroflexota bacterium]
MTAVSITVKANDMKKTVVLNADELVEFEIEIPATQAGEIEYQIPGIENPKFLIVMAEEYEVDQDPVEVMVDANTNYPMACSPAALLTANVHGGFTDAGVGTAPMGLFFNNPNTVAVKVKVLAGE